MGYKDTAGVFQDVPDKDEENFPNLHTSVLRHEASQVLKTQTFTDVLLNGRHLPFNILTKLPVELRESVWKKYMSDSGLFKNTADAYKPGEATINYFWTLPPICSIPEIRAETIRVFLRSAQFSIETDMEIRAFREFTESPEIGYGSIRRLYFPRFDSFSDGQWVTANPSLELAVDCPGLQVVQLKFWRSSLEDKTPIECSDSEWPEPHSVGYLVQRYRLRRLLDCKSLRYILWQGADSCRGSIEILQELADWMKVQFAKKNRVVGCSVFWGCDC
jgi:hypothetical protein